MATKAKTKTQISGLMADLHERAGELTQQHPGNLDKWPKSALNEFGQITTKLEVLYWALGQRTDAHLVAPIR